MNPTDLSSLEVFFLIAVMMKATSTVKIQAFIVHSGLFCCFLDAYWRLTALGPKKKNFWNLAQDFLDNSIYPLWSALSIYFPVLTYSI